MKDGRILNSASHSLPLANVLSHGRNKASHIIGDESNLIGNQLTLEIVARNSTQTNVTHQLRHCARFVYSVAGVRSPVMSRLPLLLILVTLLSLTFTFASESRRGENGNRLVLEDDEDFFARQSMMTAENYVKAQLDSVAPLPYAIGQNNYTYAHSSGVRLFYLYVPTSYGLQPTKNVSLILVLHGLTDHAINFAHGLSNMTAKAEEMGFIILYPQGSTGYRGTGMNQSLRDRSEIETKQA